MASTELFSIAQARVFDRGQLADAVAYPDAAITLAEARIRARFEQISRVRFVGASVTHTINGGSCWEHPHLLQLPEHNPYRERPRRAVTVSSATIDGVDQLLTDLIAGPDDIFHRTALWLGAWPYLRNVVITYTVGWENVPEPVTYAALKACLYDMQSSDYKLLDARMTSWSDGAANYALVTPGLRGAVYADPEINEILSEWSEVFPGVG